MSDLEIVKEDGALRGRYVASRQSTPRQRSRSAIMAPV